MVTKDEILKLVKRFQEHYKSEINPIYEMFCFEKPCAELVYANGKHSGMPDFGATVSHGFYHDIDSAISAFEENRCDMWEYCYNAGFVLCRFPGMDQPVSNNARMYFVFDKEKRVYIQKEEPEIFIHIAL